MIRRELAACVELSKREDWASDCQHFTQTRVVRYQFRWGAVVPSVLEDSDEDARFEEFLNDVIVVMRLCALVLRSDHFAGDFIRPLEIFGKDVRVRTDVARRFRQWGTDVDRKSHLASEHETRRREASRL